MLARGAAPKRTPELPYQKRRYFVTRAEQRFYVELVRSVRLVGPDLVIFPKVRMADLLLMTKGTTGREYWAAWGRIIQKHADFVILRPRKEVGGADLLKPVVVVELDDASHDEPGRNERDALIDDIYGAVRLPILHIPASYVYDHQRLAMSIKVILNKGLEQRESVST